MKISTRYQKISNRICQKHGLSPIPIYINKRLKRVVGKYCSAYIEMAIDATKATLIHELAHYLESYYFYTRKEDYYKMEMWNKMEEVSDKPGWFSATGKPESVYFKVGRMHGKRFQQCLYEIGGNTYELKWIKLIHKQ